jgi:hypothetical protein
VDRDRVYIPHKSLPRAQRQPSARVGEASQHQCAPKPRAKRRKEKSDEVRKERYRDSGDCQRGVAAGGWWGDGERDGGRAAAGAGDGGGGRGWRGGGGVHPHHGARRRRQEVHREPLPRADEEPPGAQGEVTHPTLLGPEFYLLVLACARLGLDLARRPLDRGVRARAAGALLFELLEIWVPIFHFCGCLWSAGSGTCVLVKVPF